MKESISLLKRFWMRFNSVGIIVNCTTHLSRRFISRPCIWRKLLINLESTSYLIFGLGSIEKNTIISSTKKRLKRIRKNLNQKLLQQRWNLLLKLDSNLWL